MIIPYEIIYFCIGFIAAFALSGILLLVVMKRLKNKFTTSSIDLSQIKNMIEGNFITDEKPIEQKPKYKFISKDIEIVDIKDEDVPK